jgi:hypothetical protein
MPLVSSFSPSFGPRLPYRTNLSCRTRVRATVVTIPFASTCPTGHIRSYCRFVCSDLVRHMIIHSTLASSLLVCPCRHLTAQIISHKWYRCAHLAKSHHRTSPILHGGTQSPSNLHTRPRIKVTIRRHATAWMVSFVHVRSNSYNEERGEKGYR